MLTLPAAIIAACLAPAGMAVAADHQKLPTRIDIDQAKGELVFVIDGRPAARIVSGGLVVPGDIRYGGMIMDGGSAVDAR